MSASHKQEHPPRHPHEDEHEHRHGNGNGNGNGRAGWLRRPHPVLSRTVAGLGGGYLLASAGALLVTALSAGGGKPGGDAMLAGALVGLALYALAIVWAFATGSAARAWGGMLLATALLGLPGLLLLALPGGAA
ncbi:hypothetical protein SAMN02982985_01541 [Rugamonas rubra]|uniref:Iron uptake protein n=1 Tax=Rugamonas rubra TaxID=758825 RepID=A0A1I4KJ41_9BURK|nr:hypothetical protein SAMN02982985_01541 [Rugamonas rubra]